MISRLAVKHLRKLEAWRFLAPVGLAVLISPSLAQAQQPSEFKDILFIERGIVGTSLKNINQQPHDE